MELIENFITDEEELELVKLINPDKIIYNKVQLNVNKFRFITYNELINNINYEVLHNLLIKIKAQFNIELNHVIINEYYKGQGILEHIDSLKYGNDIFIISLLSPCDITFKNKTIIKKITLNKQSLLYFHDDYRYNYTHKITNINEQRLSIVFRNKLS